MNTWEQLKKINQICIRNDIVYIGRDWCDDIVIHFSNSSEDMVATEFKPHTETRELFNILEGLAFQGQIFITEEGRLTYDWSDRWGLYQS